VPPTSPAASDGTFADGNSVIRLEQFPQGVNLTGGAKTILLTATNALEQCTNFLKEQAQALVTGSDTVSGGDDHGQLLTVIGALEANVWDPLVARYSTLLAGAAQPTTQREAWTTAATEWAFGTAPSNLTMRSMHVAAFASKHGKLQQSASMRALVGPRTTPRSTPLAAPVAGTPRPAGGGGRGGGPGGRGWGGGGRGRRGGSVHY
jgi:hypothetical protein